MVQTNTPQVVNNGRLHGSNSSTIYGATVENRQLVLKQRLNENNKAFNSAEQEANLLRKFQKLEGFVRVIATLGADESFLTLPLYSVTGEATELVVDRKVLGIEKDVSYVVMEHHTNGNLHDLIVLADGIQELLMFKHIAVQLSNMITAMYSHDTVHHGLCPEHVLIANGTYRLTLTDFSQASTLHTCKQTLVGRDAYLAPEMHSDKGCGGPLVDWWALGVTLFTIYVGCPPWQNTRGDCPWFKSYKKTGSLFRISPKTGLRFPANSLDERVKSLITGLLTIDQEKRLKFVNHLAAHPFFTTIDDITVNEGRLLIRQTLGHLP